MITIRQWFYRNAKIPILITIVGIALASATYFILWQVENQKRQMASVARLVDLGSLAIVQHNRILLESVLQHSFYELHAKKVLFCKSGRVEIGYPERGASCGGTAPNFLTRVIRRKAVGMPEYEFIFFVPVISDWGVLPLVALLSGLFLFGSTVTLLRLHRKMSSDILRPLATQLQGEAPLKIRELEAVRQDNRKLSELRMKEAVSTAILKHNARVAHDIRDPISTIDKILEILPEVSPDLRGILNRSLRKMNHIAEELLEQGRLTEPAGLEALTVEHLPDLIRAAISEKRTQIGSERIEFQCKLEDTGYGLFVAVRQYEFSRVLSNLFNNAVQAIEVTGTIAITAKRKNGRVTIEVADDGKGIPEEVLPNVGQEGFSYGKDGGSGFGIYSARKVVEKYGGTLAIRFRLGGGTTVFLSLLLVSPPAWFVPSLEVNAGMTIAVLDDEPFLHELWRSRFSGHGKAVRLVHFTSGEPFARWIREHLPRADILCLCDYELAGESLTGLDLIRSLGIAGRSVLVTGHAHSTALRGACASAGVRLLSKDAATHIPIRLTTSGTSLPTVAPSLSVPEPAEQSAIFS